MTDGGRSTRESVKTYHPKWKEKLRQNCLKRVREDRALLLWEIRSNGRQASNQKEVVDSTFWHIVTDELEKIKVSPLGSSHGISNSKNDDMLWEYDHLCSEIESEDLMIEMERMLYKDLREENIHKELELFEEEDEYLARAVFEHMQINDDQSVKSKIWCPICKRGELKETHHLIHCTDCKLQLDLENDKVNFEFLRARLAEVHMEHLDRGCRALPVFCMETRYRRKTGCWCWRFGIGRSYRACLIIPWISLRLERLASKVSSTTPRSLWATKPTSFLNPAPPPQQPPLSFLWLVTKTRLRWYVASIVIFSVQVQLGFLSWLRHHFATDF